MERQQNPNLLSMIGLGTEGGEARADDSQMERGIHLRWQMGENMGFPSGGFDLYRREQNRENFLIRCGNLVPGDVGRIYWRPLDAGFTFPLEVTAAGKFTAVQGCGSTAQDALRFSGIQSLRFKFLAPIRYIEITLDERSRPTPTATAYWRSGTADVLVAQEQARRRSTSKPEWMIRMFADRIDSVVLEGEEMVVCRLCIVPLQDSYDEGWPNLPLNSTPIYLPITHPAWDSPHPHTPNDQAEAEDRLPARLTPVRQRQYASGFQTALRDILYNLVGTTPQPFYQIGEQDAQSLATLNWSGLQLLKLMALDPNIARILGLYWHDRPPSTDQHYDYKLVAHYGNQLFPGRRYGYAKLEVGTLYGSVLKHETLAYRTPNPMEVISVTWDDSAINALFIAAKISQAPIVIQLPQAVPVVEIFVKSRTTVKASAVRIGVEVLQQTVGVGQQSIFLQYATGIDSLILQTDGDLTIFAVVLRDSTDPMGDIEYVSFHHRVETPPPLPTPTLEPPQVIATKTGFADDGTLMENQSRVELLWNRLEASDTYLQSDAPVLYQVRRSDRGNGAQPQPNGTGSILNEFAPTLITDSRLPEATAKSYYTDRNLPDGWYTYQVRGIDLFGRLGNWSKAETVQALDRLLPPPPQAVTAQYLDPTDPDLGAAEKAWTAANGSGLKVRWQWSGLLRAQAPDVVPEQAEFRIYATPGELNGLKGKVTAVTVRGSVSDLQTTLTWNGGANTLNGEFIRVGDHFFAIARNGQGNNISISVLNLTLPDLAPTPDFCSISFSRNSPHWQDYGDRTQWQRRLHVTPAVNLPIVTGLIVRIEDYGETNSTGTNTQILKPGASRTVVTDQRFTDEPGNLLPGALLCDGLIYPAYGHTSDPEGLKIHLVPQIDPADLTTLVEPAINARFTYYPGWHYEVYIPGFTIPVNPASGIAYAQVAVSCSDGKPHTPDDLRWSQPGRGGLGNRPGNEGSLSLVSQVMAVKRSLPLAPGNVPQSPSEPIFAKPANYYGQAQYTLTWEPVADAVGYAVYRCSGAALFERDRQQNQTTSVDYTSLTDAQVQALGDRPGNEAAFRRVNQDPVTGTSYLDTFDGRGQGVYLYRVRAIDAANNLSGWSATYPPVHIYDVSHPPTPAIATIESGENQVYIRWFKNAGGHLSGYRLYRTTDLPATQDWRLMQLVLANETDEYTILSNDEPPGFLFEFTDQGLPANHLYYYSLLAIRKNTDGIEFVSGMSVVQTGRPFDTIPPQPPIFISLERMFDQNQEHIQVRWRTNKAVSWLLKRREAGIIIHRALTGWSSQEGIYQEVSGGWEYTYEDSFDIRPHTSYYYSLSIRDTTGNQVSSIESQAI